jgi:hypothetical protein
MLTYRGKPRRPNHAARWLVKLVAFGIKLLIRRTLYETNCIGFEKEMLNIKVRDAVVNLENRGEAYHCVIAACRA